MKADTWSRLAQELSGAPVLRAKELPSEDEVEAASEEIGTQFHRDYREFLLRYGGAMVRAYPIFGLRPVEVMGDDEWSVVKMTQRYRDDRVPESDKWVVISEDHAGNPIGMDSDGRVWIFDHDANGVEILTDDFEGYIRTQCLELDS